MPLHVFVYFLIILVPVALGLLSQVGFNHITQAVAVFVVLIIGVILFSRRLWKKGLIKTQQMYPSLNLVLHRADLQTKRQVYSSSLPYLGFCALPLLVGKVEENPVLIGWITDTSDFLGKTIIEVHQKKARKHEEKDYLFSVVKRIFGPSRGNFQRVFTIYEEKPQVSAIITPELEEKFASSRLKRGEVSVSKGHIHYMVAGMVVDPRILAEKLELLLAILQAQQDIRG